MSLVEILVSILIVGLVLTALATTLITALRVNTEDELRTRATQLVQEELENTQALSWDATGFFESDPGYVSTYDGRTTVSLGTTRPTDPANPLAAAPVPQTTFVRDGITYTRTLAITWVDDPNDGTAPSDTDPQDYKAMDATVTWAARGRSFDLSSSAIRVPTLDEAPFEAPPTCAPGQITDYDIAPTTVELTASNNTAEAIAVHVETCGAVTAVVLDPGPLTAVPMLEVAGSDGSEWEFTIAAGNGGFPPGLHAFALTVTSPYGTATASQDVRFAVLANTLVEIGTPTLAPPHICVSGNGNNRNTVATVTFTVEISGLGSGDVMTIAWTDNSGSATGTFVQLTDTGAIYRATIPVNTTLRQSVTNVSIDARRVADGTIATQVSNSYPVTDVGTAPC